MAHVERTRYLELAPYSAQWRIPPERMKMKEPHIVPLSRQSIFLLRQIQTITGDSYGELIFPSQHDPRKSMSENTFLKMLKVLNYKGKTVAHGFRSTASTILNENGFNRDHVERQLAHAERDQVRAAYNYAEYIPERTRMMQWWADHLDRLKLQGDANVEKRNVKDASQPSSLLRTTILKSL